MSIGKIGRQITFFWGGNSPGDEIEGVREKGIKLAGSPVDVSADDSDGWRELLEDAGENTVDITISGVTKDDDLMRDWFNGSRTQSVSIVYPDGRAISGTFFLADYQDTGPYKEAVTFSATLQSTGEVTYTPASS